MKLHWSPRSPFVRKAMVCAHELGMAERIEKIYTLVSLRKPNEDMLRVNPLGRIPALVLDDGSVLYDSAVICEYLDVTFGPKLFPAQGGARWDALRRHALANGMLETGILWLAERTRAQAQQSPEMHAACERKLRSALAAAELEADRLRGGAPDIGDLTLGVVLGYLDFRYADLKWREAAPKLAEAYAVLAVRPSFVSTQPYDESAPR
ncbi:MAG TPA: glutathione S-transferase N-terminal domain-containing protein [Burkholderiales bacterium]|nr:glutathione S-transferase N-terminal domain-containing protein [Burkholderiales bacterium]